MFHAVQLILTTEIIREVAMSLQVIIYAKQNGVQMATFAATGTRADIDDLKEDNGSPGNEVGQNLVILQIYGGNLQELKQSRRLENIKQSLARLENMHKLGRENLFHTKRRTC